MERKACRRSCVAAFLVALCVAGCLASVCGAAEAPVGGVKAILFLQNRAGADMEGSMAALNGLITAELVDAGFAIIDPASVLAGPDDSVTPDGPMTAAAPLRLARLTGADTIVLVQINSLDTEHKEFQGEGTHMKTGNRLSEYTLRGALKVVAAADGATLHAQAVTVHERIATPNRLARVGSGVLNRLLDQVARDVAKGLGSAASRAKTVSAPKEDAVSFAVDAQSDGGPLTGVTVALDGAAIGSAPGAFKAAPGLHRLRLTREWFVPWEKTVNVVDGQTLTVQMELSPEGLRRFADVAGFHQAMAERQTAMDIAKEQSEADAYTKKTVADGEKKRREESYFRFDGDIEVLDLGGGDDAEKRLQNINVIQQQLDPNKEEEAK